jgi:hypothetical protein
VNRHVLVLCLPSNFELHSNVKSCVFCKILIDIKSNCSRPFCVSTNSSLGSRELSPSCSFDSFCALYCATLSEMMLLKSRQAFAAWSIRQSAQAARWTRTWSMMLSRSSVQSRCQNAARKIPYYPSRDYDEMPRRIEYPTCSVDIE